MSSNRISSFTADAGRVELYVSDCARCGVIFGMTTELEARRREDHGTFYCPNGHTMVFSGLSAAEKRAKDAQDEAARLRTKLIAERDQARAAQEEAAAAKASEARLRWRIGNGVCPCCQRSFPALSAHVATKHPDFTTAGVELSARMRQLLGAIRKVTDAEDSAVVRIGACLSSGVGYGTLNALRRRGLVDMISFDRVALTETGWPASEQVTP